MCGKIDLSPEALSKMKASCKECLACEMDYADCEVTCTRPCEFDRFDTPYRIMQVIEEIERLRMENAGYKTACESTDIFLNAVIHHCKQNWDSALKERIEELTRDNKQLDEAYKAARSILDKENQELRTKVERLEKEADWLAIAMGECNKFGDYEQCVEQYQDNGCQLCWREAASKAVQEQNNNQQK